MTRQRAHRYVLLWRIGRQLRLRVLRRRRAVLDRQRVAAMNAYLDEDERRAAEWNAFPFPALADRPEIREEAIEISRRIGRAVREEYVVERAAEQAGGEDG